MTNEWEAWRRMMSDPVIVDRIGRIWSAADWDYELHRPIPGREPRQ